MENYSTLEHHVPSEGPSQNPTPVASTRTDSIKHATASADSEHLSQKQAVHSESQPVPADIQYLFQKQVVGQDRQPVPADKQYLSQKQVVPGDYQQPAYGDNTQSAEAGGSEETRQSKTMLGLRRNAFMVAACLLAVVIIVTILGSVLGTHFAGQNSGQQKPPSAVKILDTSRLSATNFTSYDSIDHRLVYFQDEYENLICRHWKSDQKKWATNNITNSSSAAPYKPSRGSTIASATRQINGKSDILTFVFFLDNETTIRGYMNGNAEKMGYDLNGFKSSDLQGWNQKALEGSELSASYHFMQNYTGGDWAHIILAYQDPSGSIYVSNDTNFTNTSLAISADKARNDPASPLALGPFWGLDGGAMQLDWQTPGVGGGVRLAGFRLNAPKWTNDESKGDSFHSLSSSASIRDQHLAFCRDTDMRRALLLLRKTDGNVALNSYDEENGSMEIGLLEFTGGSQDNPRWESIAATHGGYFYGITDGKILEYQISPNEQGTFVFKSQVYPD